MRVRTQSSWQWNAKAFFRWLDLRITLVDPPIPDMQTLAEMAEISHSALSNWRSGRYKPSLEKLACLAGPLQVSVETVWAEAGLPAVNAESLETEEDMIIALIKSSNVSPKKQDQLIAIELERLSREREERLGRLRQQLQLMEQP